MRISVVVPTFNAGPHITALLDALRAQKPAAPDEIVAIDSGSADDTRRRVLDGGARFVEFTQPFNHGLARDAGIAATRGELIFLTVQDAIPLSEDCLARFARHFAGASVAGVSSRQIPPADGPAELKIKAAIDLSEFGVHDSGSTEAVLRTTLSDHPNYSSYTPEQRVGLYRFDNVGAMIRRSVWERIPFGACEYAEDLLWAKRALEAGHTLVRDFSAPMIHAHRRSFGYEFRRGLLDARVMDELFGFRYRLLKKANRVTMLARSGIESGPRAEAFKTYSAHALARMIYGSYRTVLKPMGLGAGIMARWTNGI